MRTSALDSAGRLVFRFASAFSLFVALTLLPDKAVNAQSLAPEPMFVAAAEATGAAGRTVESGTLGANAAAAGSSSCVAGSCATTCCDPCQDLCECFQPRWTIRSGALYLVRDRPRDQVLVTDGFSPQSTALLNASELNPGVAWGVELNAIRHRFLDTCWDLEGRYFGIDGWGAATTPVLSPGGSVVQFADPIGNINDPAVVSGSYQSRLYSVELNARRQLRDWLQILVGFRYLDLDEEGLSILRDTGPGINFSHTRVTADNQMWGFQLGADARLWSWEQLSIELAGKAGIYSNDASNHMTHTQTVTPTVYTAAAKRNNTAFEGEMGLTACYQLNRNWAFRTGYQVLWIEGVALAPDQVAAIDPLLGTSSVRTDGSPFYHGGFITLEYRR